MLRTIIVDDEEHVSESLGLMLQLNHPEVVVFAICQSVATAVQAIREHQPDLVFLDIELGNENSFEIFKFFPQPSFRVIFITAYQEYAVQAFRFSALDYLLKPVSPDILAEALSKVTDLVDKSKMSVKLNSFLHNVSDLSKNAKKIVLKTAESVHLVSVKDIMYCMADGSYTSFYFVDKTRILVSHAIGEYEDLLSDFGFFRIQQSYLLNLDYFKLYEKADGGRAILKDNTSLPVATRKKDQLLKLLAGF